MRAALFALAEANVSSEELAGARQTLIDALDRAEPLVSLHKPATAKRVVGWAATQMAMSAESPARAYSRLRELLAALFEPLAGSRPSPAPAPEVAMALTPAALVEALAASPRVLARALAVGAKLEIRTLLVEASLARRVLAVRAIPRGSIGGYATELATVIAGLAARRGNHARDVVGSNELAARRVRAEPEVASSVDDDESTDADDLPGAAVSARGAPRIRDAGFEAGADAGVLRAEAIAVCTPAADKTRAKVAEALQPFVEHADGAVRAAAVDGIHALRFQLDDDALLAALRDPIAEVRAAAARTIGTGRRGHGTEIEQRIVELVSDPDTLVRVAALGAVVRSPSLPRPALIEPLREAVARGGDQGKTALFLLGRIGAQANTAALTTRVDEPAPNRLEGSPRELETHGAYAIAALDDAIGLWDRGTGRRLVVVERAVILALIAGRAEIAVIRMATQPRSRRLTWIFERYRVPTGERLGSIAIPPQLTHGRPSQLATAADLVTVWCADPNAPYRFHVKLGDPDAVIDDAPVAGSPPK